MNQHFRYFGLSLASFIAQVTASAELPRAGLMPEFHPIHLGAMQIDGSLFQEIPLLKLEGGGRILQLSLRHELETVGGEPRSGWVVPELRSFLVQRSGGVCYWHAPGGFKVGFTSSRHQEVRATLEQMPGDEARVSTLGGDVFVYCKGALHSLYTCEGLWYSIEADGALITAITSSDPSAMPSVRATYDVYGHIQTLLAGRRAVHFDYDATTRLLMGVSVQDGPNYNFGYDRGRVICISRNSDPLAHFQWRVNGGVASIQGDDLAEYEVVSSGHRITIEGRYRAGTVRSLAYNHVTRRVTERDSTSDR